MFRGLELPCGWLPPKPPRRLWNECCLGGPSLWTGDSSIPHGLLCHEYQCATVPCGWISALDPQMALPINSLWCFLGRLCRGVVLVRILPMVISSVPQGKDFQQNLLIAPRWLVHCLVSHDCLSWNPDVSPAIGDEVLPWVQHFSSRCNGCSLYLLSYIL